MSADVIQVNVYRFGDEFFLPTAGKTEAGFLVDIEPVLRVQRQDAGKLTGVLAALVMKGNPTIRTPTRGEYGTPVLVTATRVRSWADFERGASFWKILASSESLRLVPTARVQGESGWQDVASGTAQYDPQAFPDVARDLIAG